MTNTAFLFPGQGSQKQGMLSDLIADFSIVRNTIEEASNVLDMDMLSLILSGPEEHLNRTENTQPVLLACSVALWRLWLDKKQEIPSIVAGHSLGEYSALVCAEAISFEAGLQLVRKRGRYMQEAVATGEGAMLAVIGAEDGLVCELCDQEQEVSKLIVVPVNFNAPGQIVVAGHKKAVLAVQHALGEHGVRKMVMLPVSIPSHCALMRPAAEKLKIDMETIVFNTPHIPVLQNASLEVEQDPMIIKENLIKQLYSTIYWTRLVHLLQEKQITSLFECGPGGVLTGLNKRILGQNITVRMDRASVFQAN